MIRRDEPEEKTSERIFHHWRFAAARQNYSVDSGLTAP